MGEEILDAGDDGVGIGVAADGAAFAAHLVHDDEPCVRARQHRIERGIGKTRNVVQVGDASAQRPFLGLAREAVDGDGHAVRRERGDDRFEAGDFVRGRNRLGVGIAGGGAEVDDVGALIAQLARMGDCGIGGEIAPAVRERILGDIDDAENEGPDHVPGWGTAPPKGGSGRGREVGTVTGVGRGSGGGSS